MPGVEYVGSVPKTEFDAVVAPTYEVLAEAYGITLRSDPTALHLDGPKFSRKLFDTVKSLSTKARTESRADGGESLLALSAAEWRLAIAEPVGAYQMHLAKQETETTIDEMFGQDGRQRSDKVDAFRLSYWNARSIQRLYSIYRDIDSCTSIAQTITQAHVQADQNAREIQMDLNNARVGQAQIRANVQANAFELRTAVSCVPSEYISPETPIISLDSRTVWFSGWTNLDGVWSGTLTNTDSGDETPWDAELYITTIAGKVRGELRLYRGDQRALRRFTGDTDFNTTNLSFLYPYQWELGGTSPCIGMAATLQSGGLKLQGPWTSSSCLKGGQLQLDRGLRSPQNRSRLEATQNTGCPCES